MRNFKFLLPCSLIALTLSTLTLSGCWEEQHPGTYYTFTGQTVADDSPKVRNVEQPSHLRSQHMLCP